MAFEGHTAAGIGRNVGITNLPQKVLHKAVQSVGRGVGVTVHQHLIRRRSGTTRLVVGDVLRTAGGRPVGPEACQIRVGVDVEQHGVDHVAVVVNGNGHINNITWLEHHKPTVPCSGGFDARSVDVCHRQGEGEAGFRRTVGVRHHKIDRVRMGRDAHPVQADDDGGVLGPRREDVGDVCIQRQDLP